MKAILYVQWTILSLYLLSTIIRLPEFITPQARVGEGAVRNTAVFFFFALITIAMALSIPFFYVPIDGALGGQNIANLILRFCLYGAFLLLLYGAFLLLGKRVAEAYNSKVALQAVVGPVGWVIFAVMSALMIIFFIRSSLPFSLTGLMGFETQHSVKLYSLLGFLYPAYISVCIIGVMFSNLLHADQPPVYRLASALMLVGLFGVFLLPGLQALTFSMPQMVPIQAITAYSSLGFIGAAFMTLWFAVRFTGSDGGSDLSLLDNVIPLRSVQTGHE